MTLAINLLGIGLIAFIVWWFWLSQSKVVRADQQRTLMVIVDGGTYSPDRIEVPAESPIKLTFVRKDASPCTDQVVFAILDLSFDLAMDKPTEVKLPALTPGEYPFSCQMGMYRGVLRVS